MDVEAPWPGTVQEVLVSIGDAVEEEDELLALESMKMSTPITSPAAGRVTAIHVDVGDYVDEGAALLTLEA